MIRNYLEVKENFNIKEEKDLSFEEKKKIGKTFKKIKSEKDFFETQHCPLVRQENSYDCGIFSIFFVLYSMFDKKVDFGQKDTDFLRKYLLDLIFKIMEDNGYFEDNL